MIPISSGCGPGASTGIQASNKPDLPKVVVSQKGAREHFLTARALHRRGMLALLVVDWYAPLNPVLRWVIGTLGGFLGGKGRSALAARAPEIPDNLIRVNRMNGVMGKWRQRRTPSNVSTYTRALMADIAFSKTVARTPLPDHDVFFGFSYMSLESLKTEKSKGGLTILDQIDPGPVEFRLVAEEMRKHPDLAGLPQPYPHKYYDRLRREWGLADVVVVNSEWSRDALISEGVPPEKIEVLPLAYEAEKAEGLRLKAKGEIFEGQVEDLITKDARRSLRILWLGQVNVRKGIHYLMDAARLLQDENVHFDVVGPIGILPEAVATAPKNMTFHGPVSRDRAEEWYRQADVFVLPTLSDGFALTQLEALAHGVPLITTPRCGRVVEEGKTGFIVPAQDASALADAILRFIRAPDLAGGMEKACREAVKAYSIDAYGSQLLGIIRKHQAATTANLPMEKVPSKAS